MSHLVVNLPGEMTFKCLTAKHLREILLYLDNVNSTRIKRRVSPAFRFVVRVVDRLDVERQLLTVQDALYHFSGAKTDSGLMYVFPLNCVVDKVYVRHKISTKLSNTPTLAKLQATHHTQFPAISQAFPSIQDTAFRLKQLINRYIRTTILLFRYSEWKYTRTTSSIS